MTTTTAPGFARSRGCTIVALSALGCFACHAVELVLAGTAVDLLWECNVALLLIGGGLLARRPTFTAVGTMWALFGTPLWLLDVATGGTYTAGSYLIHLGGVSLGLLGVIRCHAVVPKGSWYKAVAALVLLQQVCRLVTPPRLNINLAHGVWPGWETAFPSHFWYLAMLTALGAVTFWSLEQMGRRLVGGAGAAKGAGR